MRAWTATGGLAAATRAGGGRAAGGGQLAVGLPGQRAGRDRRPGRRMAPAPPPPRPRDRSGLTPSASSCPPPESAVLTFGIVEGSDWGWGSPPSWTLAAASRADRALRAPLPDQRQSARRSRRSSDPGRSPGRRSSPSSSRPPSGRCCSRSCCGNRGSGAGRPSEPVWPSPPGRSWSRSCPSSWPAGSSPATDRRWSSPSAAWPSPPGWPGGPWPSGCNPTTSPTSSAGCS